MKTVQEGTLADAYKRALDTANTRAIYVSYDDPEFTQQLLEQVLVDLEMDEDQIQGVLDKHESSVLVIAFESGEEMSEIASSIKTFVEGDGIVAVVSQDPEIVQAVKESFL